MHPLKRTLTAGGIAVETTVEEQPYGASLDALAAQLDSNRGAYFTSGHEAPGRYNRWDVAFVNPPLELTGKGRTFTFQALNPRGEVLLTLLESRLAGINEIAIARNGSQITGEVKAASADFDEEDRLRRPTLLTVLRGLVAMFALPEESHLGMYGAFAYDLAFQFEPIKEKHKRPDDSRDVHLYLPDEIIVVDHRRERHERRRYDFSSEDGKVTTRGLPRTGVSQPLPRGTPSPLTCDMSAADYEAVVAKVREGCRQGDYFEVVPSRVFSAGFADGPYELFRRITERNPSPYGFLINLGHEALAGASPEMYVRVEVRTVETCPISGTIARGRDALEDAEQIRRLLVSRKEESELTMCTDVDRNDKARVCEPGSIEVLGRRMIETYSKLFHTVDHVTGQLRPECDALDAFAAHMWACTLTGAPKAWAMQEIENLERSAREWYGGAVGMLRFNGTISTGITIRTVQLKDGVARLRVGATLLYDSDPLEEERETRVKASAFLEAIASREVTPPEALDIRSNVGIGKKILFVDNQDSFVHNLAAYVRQTGATVRTVRAGFPLERLQRERPDLVFISPGPGRPVDFGVPALVQACAAAGIPVFGVCLGLQGMVEAFGGTLGVLPEPVHGKPSEIICNRSGVFEGFPERFQAGRYHSLFAIEDKLPAALVVTAKSDDGVIMAVAHRTLPMAAVQFHPESILTLGNRAGHRLIANVISQLPSGSSVAL